MLRQMEIMKPQGWDLGYEAGTWTKRLRFGAGTWALGLQLWPQSWDLGLWGRNLGLEAQFWASRLGFGLQRRKLNLKSGFNVKTGTWASQLEFGPGGWNFSRGV